MDTHSRELVSKNDSDGSDGYESVTKKVNSRCFKLYLAYSISFNSSNVRTFLWSWILKKLCRSSVNFSKRKRKLLSWVHVLRRTWSNYSLLGRVMPLSEYDLRLQLTLFWYKPPSLKKENPFDVLAKYKKRALRIRLSLRNAPRQGSLQLEKCLTNGMHIPWKLIISWRTHYLSCRVFLIVYPDQTLA